MIVLAVVSFMLFVGGFAALILLAANVLIDNDIDRQVIHPSHRVSNAEWRYCDHRRRSNRKDHTS